MRPELLAPAGSPEALRAAVQNGADAVYLGWGAFNARRGAKNFSDEEFAAALAYCHERGVRVFLTLNTLVTDRELPQALETAVQAGRLGVDAVLLTPGCCDPLSRRAVRVSMGTVFQVPWTRLGSRADQWPAPGMERLRNMGFVTAALALREDSLSLREPRLADIPRLALLLGSEGDGLAPDTIAACDYTLRIPMAHGVDSLNVAAAAAVAFWQLCAPGQAGEAAAGGV